MTTEILEETTELISKLIQNKCVNPPGKEMTSIRTIEEFLTARNIPCQVFESAPNRGNLVARIKGTKDGTPRLMFGPSHVDVVPAPNPEEWEVAPFSGAVKDGYIWGRGAFDMLFIVATQVQAFAKLSEEEFQPKGDLILLIVADEERGGSYGTRWMLENHPDLIQTDYAVTETGGVFISPNNALYLVGEKGGLWKRISFRGMSGHGSMPLVSSYALQKTSQAVDHLIAYNSKIPITTLYLSYLLKGLNLKFIQRFFLTNRFLFPLTLKKLQSKNPNMTRLIHALTRTTFSPNIIKGSSNVNVIPPQAFLEVDIRTLPGQDENYVITHLNKALGDLAKEAEIETLATEEGGVVSYGNVSPTESKFVTAMEKAIQKIFPNTKLIPFISPTVSDARFFRERNVDTYGFALFDPETTMDHLVSLAHGTDERISIKTVDLSLKAYYNLAKEFLS